MEKDGEQHPTTNNDETNRACTGSTDHNNSNDQEIDHQHLANLLRRSADMVERGEFGSILYEALQDFRVYYKQKYPKTGKRRKKPHQTKDTESDIQSKIETAAPSETTDDVAGNAILKDLKESENDASSTTTQRNQKEEDGRSEDGQEKQNYKPDMPNSFSFDDGDVKEGPNDNDDNNDDDGYHNNKSNNADANVEESDEAPSANEPELNTPTAIKDKESTSSLNPNDEEQIDDIPVAMPIFTADVSVAPLSPNIRVAMATTATTTAVPTETTASILPKPSHTSDLSTQSTEVPTTPSSSNRVFGKFKGVAKFTGKVVGSTLQNVRKAAMHDGNLKSNSSGREDLDIFTEEGIDMAQCSGRRTSVSTKSEKIRIVGVKKNGDARAPQISPQNNGAKREFYSDSSFSKNPFVDDVNGHGENKNQNSAAFESKHHLNTLGEEPSGSNDTNDSAASSPEGIHKASVDHSRATSTSSETMESGGGGGVHRTKPGFQRPNDKSSSLVANGWIEQFRRSKFRYTWKEVLASLVEGTKPGEVTTLWIQRETINSTSGQMELEALHRIPLKALESVTFQDSTSDNQFRLKLHNVADEFVFRCVDAPNDALRWVQILKRHERLTNAVNDDEENKGSESSSTKGMAIRDLRAMCHGAGINTAGMERSQLEDAAEEVQRKGTYFDQKGAAATTAAAAASGPSINARHNATSQNSQQQQQQQYPQSRSRDASPAPLQPQEQHSQQPQQQRLGIKELRAICHGAGINTVGMERGELEAAAKEVQSRGTYFDPPPGMHAPSEEEIRARQDEYRKIQQQKEELKRKQDKEATDAAECRRREIEQARRRAAEDEARRRATEEEARRRVAEEEARRRAAHEEARRRASIEEQNRRQQEAQAAQVRYAQQQVAWQKQQQIEEQQRRATEHKAAEERRRRDEALRKQQEWAAPSPGVHQQQQQYYHQRQQAYPQQQQRQQQQQQPRNRTPPPRPPQQQQQQQQHRHSGSDNKYAKMANQSTDDGQVTITKIKHGILIQWALQPPQLQMLRPVSALVTTIHSIFPPALGVAGHDYFTKWKPFTRNDIAGAGGLPDDSKLKKSVRKIRFFLHPDKLPHDLNEEQKFMVKMLWDVTNDAWEEHQKHKEDLDWVR